MIFLFSALMINCKSSLTLVTKRGLLWLNQLLKKDYLSVITNYHQLKAKRGRLKVVLFAYFFFISSPFLFPFALFFLSRVLLLFFPYIWSTALRYVRSLRQLFNKNNPFNTSKNINILKLLFAAIAWNIFFTINY